jgi:DNA-directed RNA polymerase specialized sigma subunit
MSLDHEEALKIYQSKPSKENLYSVVKSLKNTINYTLASLNSAGNPVLEGKALVYTANAVKDYDPTYGAALPTYVTTQLRRLIRDQRQINSPVKIADRAMLDLYKITQAEQAYEDQHGREPDLLQLADFSGINPKRIEKVRRQMPAIPTEDAFGESIGDQTPDFASEVMDAVFFESDHVDRKILEHKTGYGGKQELSGEELARKIGISPSQVSRRAKRLSKKINVLMDQQHAVSS